MYRKILVAIDGSETSKRGLSEAFRLAAGERAQIRILNVVDESMIPATRPLALGRSADFVAALKVEGQKALKQAAAAAARKRVRVECVQRMSSGRRVSDVITSEAKKWADVLVMGTHGRRGLNRLLLGSDAERVLRDTPVPLLLVRVGDAKPPAPLR